MLKNQFSQFSEIHYFAISHRLQGAFLCLVFITVAVYIHVLLFVTGTAELGGGRRAIIKSQIIARSKFQFSNFP